MHQNENSFITNLTLTKDQQNVLLDNIQPPFWKSSTMESLPGGYITCSDLTIGSNDFLIGADLMQVLEFGLRVEDRQPSDAAQTPLQSAAIQSPFYSCAAGWDRRCLLVDIFAAVVLNEVLARRPFVALYRVTLMICSRGPRAFLATICTLAITTLLAPCLADNAQKNTSSTPGFKLLPGVSSVPVPISVAPDQEFQGIDGSWNTFSLRVGSTQHNVRVTISTASQQVWVINPYACVSNHTDEATGEPLADVDLECATSRGFLFNTTESQTWVEQGFYQLWLGKNFEMHGNGLYGFDSVGLGLPGETGPTVQNTTISTLITSEFWLGHFGLHHKPTNFSSYEDAKPSYMTNLFEQIHIPSMSFGYTAGAQYYDATVLGSLTLGGYDASRFIRNDLSFVFAPNNERDIVVGLDSLNAVTTTNTTQIPLIMRDDVDVYIDSTVAELWLPIEVCEAFEDAFGLTYDAATDLYLVDDALHQSLLVQKPNFTFTLGQKYSTKGIVNITLPYAAFDLEASPPYRGLQETTRYFPIRRGNSSQWTLGRTFLQEAYLVVDWERERFSVYANDWTHGKSPKLVPIVSSRYATEVPIVGKKSRLSTGAIIGIAVGGLFLILGAISIAGCLWHRQKRKLAEMTAKFEADANAAAALNKEVSNISDERSTLASREKWERNNVLSKAELPGNSAVHFDSPMLVEADNTERQVFEMPADFARTPEADGRQLTEKETMVEREKRYNGFDPSGTAETQTAIQHASREAVAISPSDIVMVNKRTPDVSPVTPRTPRDGALLEAGDTSCLLPQHCRRKNEAGDAQLDPMSPLERPVDRRRFSYES
ncbi:acid protease [Dothidotthia symphoricarpi CBS 119687]|uniref:Acid protease n=1 Tax=Dothidotthia symphoricarpi CBS 119687 TaxID=1392245 RepID=A0A6A6ARV3_9PLEO|nr:acid protease [Dothidotthia symphoricarpi CBS 119687]KAF2133725.1 acid protease [Dothidotthia symphoricarpi CBS 119687]